MEDVNTVIRQAMALHQKGNLEEADKLYTFCLQKMPNNPSLLNLVGLLKYQIKDYESAINYISNAVRLQPSAYFLDNLGRVFVACANFDVAVTCFKSALKLEPDNFEVWFNLAQAFKNKGLFNNAIKAYRFALKYNPKSPEVYFNLGGIFEINDKTKSAINCYLKALEFSPEDIETNYFLATSYLKIKDFENGWKRFECRPSKPLSIMTQDKLHNNRISSSPIWQGEDLTGKTLFVYYEAGLGDTIMFARYLPIVAKLCKKVIFAPQEQLISLFKENFTDMEIVTSQTLEDDIKYDFHTPIMSLAYLTQNYIQGIPFSGGYLHPYSELAQAFKEKYFQNDSLKIGIKWEGNSEIGLSRIIPVSAFSEISAMPNVKLYSIQKGDGEEDIKMCDFEITNLAPELTDFSKTAAVIDNLDLIICNDTSIAHLAGAQAIPCWVMLPHLYNWRWHDDLSFSPWYKSVKLFRQEIEGDWNSVFSEIKSELEKIANR